LQVQFAGLGNFLYATFVVNTNSYKESILEARRYVNNA
ncbi:hypothetical protein KR51_00014190, partial [Rubidibacter lacunae KORDI 51-2]